MNVEADDSEDADPGRRGPGNSFAFLAGFMLLQHATLGGIVPLLPLHYEDLGFTRLQMGAIVAGTALAPIVSPLLAGQLADRVLSARSILVCCHLATAAIALVLAVTRSFSGFLVLLTLHSLLYVPTLAISSNVVLVQLGPRAAEFGRIRLWGTIGWVLSAWVMGLWLACPSWLGPFGDTAGIADGFLLSAVLGVALAAYCLWLPATAPNGSASVPKVALAAVLPLLRDRSFQTVLGTSVLVSALSAFVYPVGALYLRSRGASDAALGPIQSSGQVVEVFAFWALASLLRCVGMRGVLLIGLACWVLRFAVWTFDAPWPVLLASVGLHGICYAYVYGAGQMYFDFRVSPDARATAQALHLLVAGGLGPMIGNPLVGWLCDVNTVDLAADRPMVDYPRVFGIAAVLSLAALALFVYGFTPTRRPEAAPSESSGPAPGATAAT